MAQPRELLELAANAAGLNVDQNSARLYREGAQDFIEVKSNEHLDWVRWNPLTDDGDALRLAVTMGRIERLSVEIQIVDPVGLEDAETGPYTSIYAGKYGEHSQFHCNDPFAATRRAIVIAASRIVGVPTQRQTSFVAADYEPE